MARGVRISLQGVGGLKAPLQFADPVLPEKDGVRLSSLSGFSIAVLLPLLLITVSAAFRITSQKKFGMLYDEQITRSVADNIWKGDLRNNWRYVANMPAAFQIDCYNFSSYMYADALAAGPRARHPLFRERLFSGICGTLAVAVFYLVTLKLIGRKEALAALAIMAVFPLLVQDAHYARPEAFATLLCGLVYLLSVLLLRSRRALLLLGASCFICGLLAACKISLVPMIAVPIVCLLARRLDIWRSTAIVVSCFILGFFVGVPDAFFQPRQFWAGVEYLRHQYANEHPPHSLIDSSYCLRLLLSYFWQTMGILLCLLFAAGQFFWPGAANILP